MPPNKPLQSGDETRERICEAVRRQPGIHKSALKEELGLGWGTIVYQLQVLCERGVLRTWSRGRHVHVFPANFAPDRLRWLSALYNAPAAAIITRLAAMPGQSVQVLARTIGVSTRVLRRHIAVLRDEGIVRCDEGLRPRYWLTTEPEGVPIDFQHREPPSAGPDAIRFGLYAR